MSVNLPVSADQINGIAPLAVQIVTTPPAHNTVTIDWADGSPIQNSQLGSGGILHASHTFTQSGIYNVHVHTYTSNAETGQSTFYDGYVTITVAAGSRPLTAQPRSRLVRFS